ncbi:MAG TPA: MFS transporter [Tepidisphaeraceae bacterium]|jgi:sugar phosphate permease|nr:MFS transporter [Tepidisphaeraceae bacterium]
MTELDSPELVRHYPPGFRPRRGLNWGYLGLLYTSFYLCRFNLTVANKTIANQYGFSYSQMSTIIFTSTLVYAFGQIFNGLLTDRIGGKKAMLIGAAGTVVMNIAFGAASVWGILGLFIAIRGIDGYFQSFGAPGMTKIKTAWFAKTERGGFAGIFGFMINLGRLGIFNFGPALLTGFTLFGMLRVDPLGWKWLFWGPSIVCAVVAVAMAFGVKETPEEHGYLPVEEYSGGRPSETAFLRGLVIAIVLFAAAFGVGWCYHIGKLGPMDVGIIVVAFILCVFVLLHVLAKLNPVPVEGEDSLAVNNPEAYEERATRADIQVALRTIVRNPAVWVVAAAYACTGAVRNPIDSWFARYMQEAHHTEQNSSLFLMLAFLIPCSGSAGSLLSGYISDKLFKGARSPVAAGLYFMEIVLVILATFLVKSPQSAVFFLVALSFTANATHSILGTAAAMDIGGRKMTGFASGLIDSFQYFGATLGLWALGHLLDKYGWNALFPYMIPFGIIGFMLMIFGRNVIARGSQR